MLIKNKLLKTTAIAVFATTATLSLTTQASAITATVDSSVVTGTITDGVNTSNASVDYWFFDVATAGSVTIDLLSRGVLAGNTASGLSDLDTQLQLFEFDPTGDLGFLGDFVSTNDDDFSTPQVDGSIDGFDSYLVTTLDIGSYALAISDFSFNESEARLGLNDSSFDGTFADYQITFSGIDIPAVPLPAGLPLMLGGFGALSFLRRKRSS